MATAPGPIDIYSEQETFYVPVFEVKILGEKLPAEIVRDVLQVTYKDSVKEIDSFELTFANWDAAKCKPKYEPWSEERHRGVFDPGKTLELRMGYLNNTRLMLTGEITTLEPDFPASGGLTLRVRGLNVLHRFRSEQHTYGWFDRRDSDIAKELGERPVRSAEPGLGIRVETDPLPDEARETSVFMNSQYDIVFLMERARRHGYEVALHERMKNNRPERFLTFGPASSLMEVPTYRLEWGKSLLSFRPTLSTAKQISQVEVRGWDRRRNRLIVGKATWQDCVKRISGPERQRLQQLAQAFGNRHEVITDFPVHSEVEAKNHAKDVLLNQLNQMVEASGSTVGLPDLRAGGKIQIVGCGSRFDGEYYVTDTTHIQGDNGYTTEFSAKRLVEQPGSGANTR